MGLREKIEAARTKGERLRTDLDYASKKYTTEKNKAARRLAKLKAKEILEELPHKVAERAEKGLSLRIFVCSVGEIRTLDELRRAFGKPGCYVLKALEKEDYEAEISFDCSGNWTVENSLMVQV